MRGNGLDSSFHRRPPRTNAVNGAAVLDRHRFGSLPTLHRKPPAERSDTTKATSPARVVLLVFLPFASGYYLSYLYRSINALISEALISEFGLSPANLGFLTATYFLAFALIQLPLGVSLDRFGPRRVQAVLLSVAAAGAALFASADGFLALALGRGLIGLGVAGALMAGLKAIVLWFPAERIALANGWFIMLGALGAVTATAPAEIVLAHTGWRGLFAVLAAVTAVSAIVILLIVPERRQTGADRTSSDTIRITAIYRDPRFWRLAPLSASCIGSAWALQGLWAASPMSKASNDRSSWPTCSPWHWLSAPRHSSSGSRPTACAGAASRSRRPWPSPPASRSSRSSRWCSVGRCLRGCRGSPSPRWAPGRCSATPS